MPKHVAASSSNSERHVTLLSTGSRILGVAAWACLVSGLSFYVAVMAALSSRYALPHRVYEGLFLATVGVGGVAIVSALTPRHRLSWMLLGLDGALLISSVAIASIDQAGYTHRRRAQVLSYQDRIVTQLSQGRLLCIDGYEVHCLPQLVYFQRGNGDVLVQTLAHTAIVRGQCEMFTNAELLNRDRQRRVGDHRKRLQTCTNQYDERLEDWLTVLADAACL